MTGTALLVKQPALGQGDKQIQESFKPHYSKCAIVTAALAEYFFSSAHNYNMLPPLYAIYIELLSITKIGLQGLLKRLGAS